MVIVAAPGPALTKEVARSCQGQRVLAVGDAWRRIPWAEVLYHCDTRWWDMHKGCPEFSGEKWSSHDGGTNKKLETAKKYGLRLVAGDHGKTAKNDKSSFSLNPERIHYGRNSGFQALNLAILFGGNPLLLVGFDMHGAAHFDGPNPKGLRTCDYSGFAKEFDQAAELLPPEIQVWNATPGSAIKGFKRVALEDVLVRQAA